MNGYRLAEVSERGGVVRETYTAGEGWDANGSPVVHVERKRRVIVGQVDHGRALGAFAVASLLRAPK